MRQPRVERVLPRAPNAKRQGHEGVEDCELWVTACTQVLTCVQ